MDSFCKKNSESYKVTKPWGYEFWICSGKDKSKFVMKEIFIKAGYKTSFQFHEHKDEAAIIISGQGFFYLSEKKIDLNKYKKNEYEYEELQKIINKLKKNKISPGSTMRITPGYIHSIEAVSDIKLIESSTLEVDDVYRIFDEHKRGDGRINSEHLK